MLFVNELRARQDAQNCLDVINEAKGKTQICHSNHEVNKNTIILRRKKKSSLQEKIQLDDYVFLYGGNVEERRHFLRLHSRH